jgi:hypothetical protein
MQWGRLGKQLGFSRTILLSMVVDVSAQIMVAGMQAIKTTLLLNQVDYSLYLIWRD